MAFKSVRFSVKGQNLATITGVKGEPVAIGKLERFVADYSATTGANPVEANSYVENATAYLIAGQSSQKLSKNADAIKYFVHRDFLARFYYDCLSDFDFFWIDCQDLPVTFNVGGIRSDVHQSRD